MSMYYFAGFDISDIGPGTLSVATAGKTTIVQNLATLAGPDQSSIGSSLFFHYFINGTWKIQGEHPEASTRLDIYSSESLGRSLRTALRALASSASWGTAGSSLDITGYYSFTSSASITLTFSNATGAALFGFTSTTPTGGTTVSSNATPSYMIIPTLTATSRHTPNYEPDGIANHVVADDGRGFGLSRTVSPLYRDWIQQYETVEKSLRLSAQSSHPWTFQHLREHCRGEFPFIVSQGFGLNYDEAFSFRTEDTRFITQFAGADQLDGTHCHHNFKTVVEGKVVQLT